MPTSLPTPTIQDSGAATKLFFDTYGKNPLEFTANDVDATIGFFTSKGFDNDAAQSTALTLLKQAKIDRIPVFQILDTLKVLTGIQLSALVGEILNNNRGPSSTLGFKVKSVEKQNQTRNIYA
jgi:hypothetical protein